MRQLLDHSCYNVVIMRTGVKMSEFYPQHTSMQLTISLAALHVDFDVWTPNPCTAVAFIWARTVIATTPVTYPVLQVDGATFTFVDLPGIQQWPSAYSKTSKALVSSYLTDATQDTPVLCVVDASTAADLVNSAAIREIADAGKLGNTILALTKCDVVQDVDSILANIFDPLEECNGCSSKAPGIESSTHVKCCSCIHP